MHVYILLDRSGSMQTRWTEALGSINAYVSDLAAAPDLRSAKVTLAAFDAHEGLKFDVLRAAVPAGTWMQVGDAEASPRGMTPLFDAVGRLMALADADAPDKAVIVVMTDGEENASREVTREAAKAAFDRARHKGWQVVFLGADFDAFGQAASVGAATGQTIQAAAPALQETMVRAAGHTAAYARAGKAFSWSEDDRRAAKRK